MSVVKEKFILTLSYEMSVDTSTGEILETKLIDRKVDKSDIKVTKKVIAEDSDTEPKLVLESNKYCLNSAAIALMGIEPDDKLDIKYDGTVLPCPAFKEMSIETMEKYGIKLHSIYEDLEKVVVHEGKRAKPLCKQVYGFDDVFYYPNCPREL